MSLKFHFKVATDVAKAKKLKAELQRMLMSGNTLVNMIQQDEEWKWAKDDKMTKQLQEQLGETNTKVSSDSFAKDFMICDEKVVTEILDDFNATLMFRTFGS